MFIVSSDQLLEMSKDPLTPHHILKIKHDVGTCWYEVGVELGIENGILQCTDRDYRTSEKKAHKVLEKWTEQKGKEATVGRLAYALITIGHKWIADKLFGM